MIAYRLAPAVLRSIDEINDYTAERWGEAQAAAYTEQLFYEFDKIATREVPWRALPTSFRINGFRRSWEKHLIYWRVEPDTSITFVAVLHHAMDQMTRAASAFRQRTR